MYRINGKDSLFFLKFQTHGYLIRNLDRNPLLSVVALPFDSFLLDIPRFKWLYRLLRNADLFCDNLSNHRLCGTSSFFSAVEIASLAKKAWWDENATCTTFSTDWPPVSVNNLGQPQTRVSSNLPALGWIGDLLHRRDPLITMLLLSNAGPLWTLKYHDFIWDNYRRCFRIDVLDDHSMRRIKRQLTTEQNSWSFALLFLLLRLPLHFSKMTMSVPVSFCSAGFLHTAQEARRFCHSRLAVSENRTLQEVQIHDTWSHSNNPDPGDQSDGFLGLSRDTSYTKGL